MSFRKTWRNALAVALSLAALGALSSTAIAQTQPPAPGTNKIYDMLPKDIKDKGYIVVATDPQFGPPTNYHPVDKPDEWAGVEPDLLRALEPVMGVPFKVEQATFQSIIPGVVSGRYDLGVNALGDTAEREQVVDMIAWWQGHNILVVRKGNPKNIKTVTDLCGTRMAVVQGSSEQIYMQDFSAKTCPADKPVELLAFAARPDCVLALQTDRVDSLSGGDGFVIRLVYNLDGQQGDAAKLLELQPDVTFDSNMAGPAVQKGRDQFREAIMAGITKLMDDGTYAEILRKWHWPESGILTKPVLNAASAQK